MKSLSVECQSNWFPSLSSGSAKKNINLISHKEEEKEMASENEEELMPSRPHSLPITEDEPSSPGVAVATPHASVMQKFRLYETESVIALKSFKFVYFIWFGAHCLRNHFVVNFESFYFCVSSMWLIFGNWQLACPSLFTIYVLCRNFGPVFPCVLPAIKH